jgi:hypothetical protein
VSLKKYIIGNNGMAIISLIYIYIGASAAKIVTIFTDKDSTLHKSEIYLLSFGCVFLLTMIIIFATITRRELNKYIKAEERKELRSGD